MLLEPLLAPPVVRATRLRSGDHRPWILTSASSRWRSSHVLVDLLQLDPARRLVQLLDGIAIGLLLQDLLIRVSICLLRLLRELFERMRLLWLLLNPLFLAPSLEVQALASFTQRVYHIQLIKSIILLNNFITYSVLASCTSRGLGRLARVRSHRGDSCWVNCSFVCILVPGQYLCIWLEAFS